MNLLYKQNSFKPSKCTALSADYKPLRGCFNSFNIV